MKGIWDYLTALSFVWLWMPVVFVFAYKFFGKLWSKWYLKDKEHRKKIKDKLTEVRETYRHLYWEQGNSLPLVEKCVRYVLISIGGGNRDEIEEFVKKQTHVEGYIMNQVLPVETIHEFREKAKKVVRTHRGNMWKTIGWQIFRVYVFLQLLYFVSLLPQPELPIWIPFITAGCLYAVWWKEGRTLQILIIAGLFYFLYAHMSLSGNVFLIVLLGSGLLKKFWHMFGKQKEKQ